MIHHGKDLKVDGDHLVVWISKKHTATAISWFMEDLCD